MVTPERTEFAKRMCEEGRKRMRGREGETSHDTQNGPLLLGVAEAWR